MISASAVVAGRGDRRHAGEAVQQPVEALEHHRHARLRQRIGVGLAFVAQRIEAGGDDQRRREAGEVLGEQGMLRRVACGSAEPV